MDYYNQFCEYISLLIIDLGPLSLLVIVALGYLLAKLVATYIIDACWAEVQDAPIDALNYETEKEEAA